MAREETIFVAALAKGSPSEQSDFLDRACAGDARLRRDIEALLAAHRQAEGILESPPVGPDRTGLQQAGPGPLGPDRLGPDRLGPDAIGPDLSGPDLPPSEGVGSVVGPYRLVEKIGGGGMGVVYMAEQLRPVRRRVALKIIKPGMDSGAVIARFEAERQALALMDHENIAKVFEAGTTAAGRPYFVMELVGGLPITDYCDGARLTTRERLDLFVRVCHAVQHAHRKGVIHRDLKPGNVLVALHDGRPVPKVIDFGIAKATGPALNGQVPTGHALTERTLFTHFAQVLGTPLYMSPEQAQMGGLDVDTRSDVYSLGVLLYELLTGTTPFDKQRLGEVAHDEMRRIIREEDPPTPSTRLFTLGGALVAVSARRGCDPKRLGRVVRGELDWIVMKALEKDRARRYESPDELAADVGRYLREEAVLACPPSKWYRFRKFAARRRAAFAVASGMAVAVLLAVVALAASSVLVWRANDGLRQSLGREQTESYFQRITVSHRELTSSDNLGRALQVLDECPPVLRGWEWRYLKRLCRVEPLVLRDGGEVASVAFSPDGERLASAGADGAVKIWNSRTGKVVQTVPAHRGWALSVAFHPDGRHVVSAGADRLFRVWDLADGREVFSGPCAPVHLFGGAYAVAFSPDGAKLAAGGDGALRVYDWQKRELLRTLPDGQERAATLAFSRDGRRLASGTWAGAFKLWDGAEGAEPLRSFPQDRFPVTALAFSPDGTRLAQAGFDRRVKVWDPATGVCVLPSLQHTGIVGCVDFSADGTRIASGGADKVVRLWDAATGRRVLDLGGHTDGCLCLAFSPDGHRLASAGADGTIRLWDATPLRGDERQEASSFAGHADEVWRGALSPDGRRIASGGFRTPAKVWDPTNGHVAAEFNGHPFVCFDLSWQPDGTRIASAGFDGAHFAVRVWESQTGHDVFAVTAPAEVYAAEYSPDGRHLVMAGMGRAIQVMDAGTGRLLATLGTHAREIRGLTFSRDGRHLASEGGDGEIKLWDATRLTDQQEPRVTLRARVPGQCLNVAFSPDGACIATGGEENTVKVWDVQSGRLLHTLRGHSADVYTVAFSPGDGRWLASAGEDSTVKIWDKRTAKLVRSFRGHTAPVSSVAFSPDGRTLYSGSRDHTVKTWDLTPLEAAPASAPVPAPSTLPSP